MSNFGSHEVFSKNLRKYMKKNNISRKELSDALGVAYSTFSDWYTGKKYPRIDKIELIANYFGISKSDLIENETDEPLGQAIYIPKNIIPLPKASKSIPLIGTIACGAPILAEENIEAMLPLPDFIRADFALRCKGDSMVDARILDGDFVYIRKQPDVENGEIAAVLIDDEATLKRVYKYSNQIVLQPANPAYPPLVYVNEQMDTIRILGKAVYFVSAVR